MNTNLFEDIEQDNNPSFYGNQSILNDPYGYHQSNDPGLPPNNSVPSSHSTPQTKFNSYNDQMTPQNSHSAGQSDIPTPNQNPSTHHLQTPPPNNDLVNSTIGLSNKINDLLNDANLNVDIISSERLVGSSVIVYSIELSTVSDDRQSSIIVKRRYSEFKSLRDYLIKLYPTLIIPPIPEKHSLFTFLVNSINNANEVNIIEMRKRYFKTFLKDLIFDSNIELKNCVLLHKFLDPNYELCWYNAINEPPANLIPNNLLLANPINPIDQNGLYSILPVVNGFEFNSNIDNLSSLKKLNEDMKKLKDQIILFDLKGNDYYENKKKESLPDSEDFDSPNFNLTLEDDGFSEVPTDLIQFEIKFHHIIRILGDLNKLNSRSVKNYKSVANTLIELGGNLNNFSLQIYESSNYHNQDSSKQDNSLSLSIEKFGSTVDSNFLNFEGFIGDCLVPQWQEPVHQLIQYYTTSLNLIKFYKYKIIQFKLLYKLKFNKFQELLNLALSSNTFNPSTPTNNGSSLDHLKELNSPTILNTLQRIESKKKRAGSGMSKKSWYGLFGGNNSYNKQYTSTLVNEGNTPTVNQFPNQFKFKISQIEKELNKLNQLIELTNNDMVKLTIELSSTYKEFLNKLEEKWLVLMISYIKNGKQFFNENLVNWNEFREFLKPEN